MECGSALQSGHVKGILAVVKGSFLDTATGLRCRQRRNRALVFLSVSVLHSFVQARARPLDEWQLSCRVSGAPSSEFPCPLFSPL